MPLSRHPAPAPQIGPAPALPVQVTGSTVRMVAETLGARIASGDYPLGSRLPSERALAVNLKVARNTLRDALDLLVRQGLVTRRAGAGSWVADPGDWGAASPVVAATGPLHLHVMRGILEPEIARLAVLNMPPAAIDALPGLLDRMRAAPDPARFARLEEEFHLKLAEGTGNPLLLACYQMVLKARRQRHQGANARRLTPDNRQHLLADYAALADALAQRDTARAVGLIQQALLDEQRLLMSGD